MKQGIGYDGGVPCSLVSVEDCLACTSYACWMQGLVDTGLRAADQAALQENSRPVTLECGAI